ncbi:MAG: DUF2007 domain-containing protein [Acidobacteriaceae bacterium]|nr:DUF2007 domain-containing protein [Acidobacteriaceae bacterium]
MSEQISNTGELVTVATFPEPASAQVALMALESEGILAFLQGENANGLIPVAFAATLRVRAEDEAAARKVLDGAEFAPLSEEEVLAAEIADERGVE